MVLLKEIVHLIIQHGPLRLGNAFVPMCFLPKALLQGTQSLLEAMQVIAGPVLIEDTIKTNK